MDSTRTHIFLDTSVYLHCRHFVEVDWHTVVGVRTATLVLSAQVLREIDKQKDQHRSRAIRERARRTIKKINELHSKSGTEVEVRRHLQFRYYRQPPTPDIFSKLSLDSTIPDDYILATVCAFRDAHPSDNIILVTRDGTMQLTGSDLGLRVVSPPAEIELDEEPDPLEKENRELKRELHAINSRQPILTLSFEGEANRWEPLIAVLDPPSDDELQQIEAMTFKNFPPSAQFRNHEHYRQWSRNEIRRYDQERVDYAADLQLFRVITYRYDELISRTLRLSLHLTNAGTAPATDVSVELTFPSGLMVGEQDDQPGRPKPPVEPKLPARLVFDGNTRPKYRAEFELSRNERQRLSGYSIPEIWGPEFKRDAEGRMLVTIPRGKLQQATGTRIGPLFVVFQSYDAVIPFGISYRIRADEISPVDGHLHIIPQLRR